MPKVNAALAYLVVTVLSGLVIGRLTGWTRPPEPARATLDLADTARKVQSVLSSLAGFAVTSLVLLITLAASRLDMHEERSVDLIALLVVAYLGFVVGAIMYAHTEAVVTATGLDLLAVQHAIASCQFFRSIVSGWLALGRRSASPGPRATRCSSSWCRPFDPTLPSCTSWASAPGSARRPTSCSTRRGSSAARSTSPWPAGSGRWS